MPKLIEFRSRASEPLQVGSAKIVLRSRALEIRLPFGGLIWNRPLSVSVLTADGREIESPIYDVTRWAIWALTGLTVVAAMLISSTRNRR